MRSPPHLRRLLCPALVAAVVGVAGTLGAGPWSQLPEAVTRLQVEPDSREALAVVMATERSVLAEASAGRLTATDALVDAYSSLVSPLFDGPARAERLRRRVASALFDFGRQRLEEEPSAAGRAWALAAELAPEQPVLEALRGLLLPPSDPQPGQVWLSAADGSELVWLPPTRFMVGCTQGDLECRTSEMFLRPVEVPGFWVERTEVTNRRYRLCVVAGACKPPSESTAFADPARADEPVVGLSWYQARSYALWLGRRLPSEAEWERVARGQHTDWRYPWGSSRAREHANVHGGLDSIRGAAPVGSFPATGWGVFDIAGNVWEWCEDTYHQRLAEGPEDGSAWTEGGWGRVLRGGSWRRTIEMGRVSARTWQEADYAVDDVGFRCVADAVDTVQAEALVSLAASAFPLASKPGRELEQAQLVATDRRYLDRRAMTWLVLEGRAWDALAQAVALIQREPRDRVAADLVARLEQELLTDAERGRSRELGWRLDRYRDVLVEGGPLDERRVVVEKKLLQTLQAAAEQRQRRGQLTEAADCYRLALSLAPGDPKLLNLLRATHPEPGARRRWAGDGKEMVWIPGGNFIMGRGRGDDNAGSDEQPAHTVWVEAFWLDRSEVTNAEYRRCVEAGACTPPHLSTSFDDPEHADHPVLWVDWYQARSYARWAGKRLPTETEWERAARTGTTTRYPWGDSWEPGAANSFGTRWRDLWSGPSPVGSFPASPWGAVDMLGNAWEWVEDVYHSDFRGAPRDGRAWTQVTGGPADPERVLRGGSYINFPPKLRVSQRDHRSPEGWFKTTGFRCAADADSR